MIVGQPGAGKSYLARKLGNGLNLPVVHIDKIHYLPGWVDRPNDEKDRLCAEVHASDEWIFEGGRSNTWPERLRRADVLIWLDFPIGVRSWRVFWRTLHYLGKSRPDLQEGCPDRFSWEFTHWIWRTRNTSRLKILKFYESADSGKLKIRLQTHAEVSALLAAIKVAPHPAV